MPEVRVTAIAERWCAAPREAILAFERDPHSGPITEPRMRVSKVVPAPGGVGTTWTSILVTGRVLQLRLKAELTALDPVVVEGRWQSQVQTTTATVSESPDDQGRYLLTYQVEVVSTPMWAEYLLHRLALARSQRTAQRDLDAQIDRAVAAIEDSVRAH